MKTKIYHDDYQNITLWKIDKKYFFVFHEKEDKTQNNILIPIENVTRFIERFLADRTNFLNTSITDGMQYQIDKDNNKVYFLEASRLVVLINESPVTLLDVDNLFLNISDCSKYIAEMAKKGNGDAIQLLLFLTTGKRGTNDICPLQLDMIKAWNDDDLEFLRELAEKGLMKLFRLADEGNLVKKNNKG
jgi:hypothetical protein